MQIFLVVENVLCTLWADNVIEDYKTGRLSRKAFLPIFRANTTVRLEVNIWADQKIIDLLDRSSATRSTIGMQ